jgi:hypothetical protein
MEAVSSGLLRSAFPLKETVSMTTSSPAGIGGVSQLTLMVVVEVLTQSVVKGCRAALSWSRMSVAIAAFTALGVTMAVNAKDSATAAATNMIVLRVFHVDFLFGMEVSPF